MTNHLRVALKHHFTKNNKNTVAGNFKIIPNTFNKQEVLSIYHLNFYGEKEFHTCDWNPKSNTIFIYKTADGMQEEIIFVIRTIRKLGFPVDHILYQSMENAMLKEDISCRFTRYIQ